MAELKTRVNDASVDKFLKGIPDEAKRADSYRLLEMMSQLTGQKPRMWGSSIVGFGKYHYVYDACREGDWFVTGFSPRKQNLTLYIMPGFEEYDDLLGKLGKHSIGKSCLYVKRLEDVDMKVLKQVISKSVKRMKKTNPK